MWLSMTMEGQSHSEGGGRNFYRNVTVLLSTDVNKRNDQVFMPNTINMATIKKKGKGQYVNRAHFSDDMSDEEVKRRLISLFPNLENQRYIYTFNCSVFYYFSILPYECNSIYKLCVRITFQNKANLQVQSRLKEWGHLKFV